MALSTPQALRAVNRSGEIRKVSGELRIIVQRSELSPIALERIGPLWAPPCFEPLLWLIWLLCCSSSPATGAVNYLTQPSSAPTRWTYFLLFVRALLSYGSHCFDRRFSGWRRLLLLTLPDSKEPKKAEPQRNRHTKPATRVDAARVGWGSDLGCTGRSTSAAIVRVDTRSVARTPWTALAIAYGRHSPFLAPQQGPELCHSLSLTGHQYPERPCGGEEDSGGRSVLLTCRQEQLHQSEEGKQDAERDKERFPKCPFDRRAWSVRKNTSRDQEQDDQDYCKLWQPQSNHSVMPQSIKHGHII